MELPLWRLRTWRRKLWEAVGSIRYSVPCSKSILSGLERYVGASGFFIEVGALDGFFESNTYYFEVFHSWRGILIEPIPEMYSRLKVNRPAAISYHCALVPPGLDGDTVQMSVAHAMSSIASCGDRISDEKVLIDVPARTLSSIIDEVNPDQIDLLSLDVEGFEIEVLRGLNFDIHRPRYMLIECLTAEAKEKMDCFLRDTYTCVDQFTYRDFLYAFSGSSKVPNEHRVH